MNPVQGLVLKLLVSAIGITAQDYEFQIIKRGYQILDPVTGHVLPPSLNTYKRGPTRHYQRPQDQKKNGFFTDLQEFHETFSPESTFEEKNYYPSHEYEYDSYEPAGFYYPLGEEETSVNHHYDGGNGYEETSKRGPFTSFFDNHASELDIFNVPRPHRIYKKQVSSPYSKYETSISSRPQQPHKQRKKYPYYGRKKRSPLELLDPMTGRTIQRPVIKYRPQLLKQTSRLPLRNVQSSRSNRHLFGSSDVRTKRQPVLATNGYFASPVRATRNIAIPVLNDDTDVNRFRRPNLGGEYYSVYSGLPVYKYTKKHPHGYHGRRKRQAIHEQNTFKRDAQWVLLDPWTGHNVEEQSQNNNQSHDKLFQEVEADLASREERGDDSHQPHQLSQFELDRYQHKYHKKYPYRG